MVSQQLLKAELELCRNVLLTIQSCQHKIQKMGGAIGSAWSDSHREEFCRIIDDCTCSLESVIRQLSSIVTSLIKLSDLVREYDETGIRADGNSSSSQSNGGAPSQQYTYEETRNIILSAGRDWADSLSTEQRHAIADYSGTAYLNINSSLRGQTDFSHANANRAVSIHTALSATSIPCPCTVYRGASNAALGQYRYVSDQELVGMVIEDAGFMSTSISPSDAFSGDVRFEIEVPTGAHGAYIGYISSMGHDESEVLFDAGTLMQITGIRYENGNRIISTRML